MALGDFHSRIQSPIVAMYLILFHYNSIDRVVLPFIFSVRKFLQLPVQVAMGFLTRPVTADESCYGSRYNEYTDDYEGSLHHASVPFVCPRYSAIPTALMNMPASMYTKSI